MNEQSFAEKTYHLKQGSFPFESRFIEINNAKVHYVDEGSGPVILFLHGNPTWSFLYRNIIKSLRDEFRCVALDYPGFGLSTTPGGYGFTPKEHAQIVSSFIEQLDLSRFTLMIHDWGGPIGIWAAGQHLDKIDRLIIGNTWAWPVNGYFRFECFSRLMGGPIGRFVIQRFNAFVNWLAPLAVRRQRLSPEIMNAYRAPFPTHQSRLPTYVFPKEILKSRGFLKEVENTLYQLATIPTLILWGDSDIAFQSKERQRFEFILTHHTTVIMKNAGHFIQEDAPDELAKAISQWMKSTPKSFSI